MSDRTFIADGEIREQRNKGPEVQAAAVASDLVGKIHAQLPTSNPPITISSTGAGININWSSVGSAGNVAVTTTSTTTQPSSFSAPSFASCAITANPQSCTASLTGGQDPYASGIAHPMTTPYTYDGLGNLSCVEQPGDAATGYRLRRTTEFRRIESLANSPVHITILCRDSSVLQTPRSTRRRQWGPTRISTTYSYDANGNLLQKSSPAPNQQGASTQTISYCYEQLWALNDAISCSLSYGWVCDWRWAVWSSAWVSHALTRFMSKLLFGIAPSDAFAFAGVVLLLCTVALVACYVPAHRAMRFDPTSALPHE